MEQYSAVSFATSKLVTECYSTSFSFACRLFPTSMRRDIYGIYGLVRLADEIVDSYRGADQLQVLDDLEATTYASLATGYSSNLLVHSFAEVSRRNQITKALIQPFFASMRQDIGHSRYNQAELETYIYGSAEVVGLMCLRVFVTGDNARYERLVPGARSLGSAFQKVNFLRDLAQDQGELGRTYFPEIEWDNFDEATKMVLENDILVDFEKAYQAIPDLPKAARPAVIAAYNYYMALLSLVHKTSAEKLKVSRLRIADGRKLLILSRAKAGGSAWKPSL